MDPNNTPNNTIFSPNAAPQPPMNPVNAAPTPEPGAPSHSRKKWWIIGIAVLVLAILGVRVFSILTNNSNHPSQAQIPVTKTNVASVPGQPVACAPSVLLCVPSVKLSDVVAKITKLGYSCAPDTSSKYNDVCKFSKDGLEQQITFSNPEGNMSSNNVNMIAMDSSTQEPGNKSADLSGPTWQLNNITFGQVIDAVFSKYSQVQQDLQKWVKGQTGACNYPTIESHDTVDGYQINCQKAAPINVGSGGTSVTTWTSDISIREPAQ